MGAEDREELVNPAYRAPLSGTQGIHWAATIGSDLERIWACWAGSVESASLCLLNLFYEY